MPKKSSSARGGAQRNRPKVQKNIELVRQGAPREQRSKVTTVQEDTEQAAISTATATTPEPEVQNASESAAPAPEAEKKSEEKIAEKVAPVSQVQKANGKAATPAAKGSASARLAARRQGGPRSQRSQAPLITAEHFTYVRKDLITIGILAGIMVVAMIILYFVLVVNGLF
jgi:hypothetical protein